MSWVKMTTFLSVIKSSKRVLIIAWKVAGEFVNLKNMTVGSYSPRFIEKAAVYLYPRAYHSSSQAVDSKSEIRKSIL
jgi:hypothetical protein